MRALPLCFALLVFLGGIVLPSMLVFKIFEGSDFTLEALLLIFTISAAILVSRVLKRRQLEDFEIRELIGGDRFYIRLFELVGPRRKR